MTVQSEISSVTHACDGVTTAFPVPYRFLVNTDLVVTLIEPSGDEEIRTVLTLGTDYMVTGAGADAGGTITTAVDYPVGDQLEIVRDVPLTQLTEYQPSGPFPAKSHERALDKVTMITQQLDRRQMQSEADIEGLKEFDQQIGDLVQQAADSAAAAQTAAEASEAALYEFRGVYLGAQPSDPIVDLNGDPVTEGDFYFNIPNQRLRVYSGGAWSDGVDGITEAQLAAVGGAAMVGYQNPAANSATQTVQGVLDTIITPYTFGAVGDGVADDTLAMQRFASSTQSRAKDMKGGKFKITAGLQFNPGDVVTGNGAEIDATAVSGFTCLSVSGVLQNLPNLSTTAFYGTRTISFASAHGLAVGDVFVIYNPTASSFSPWRTNYRAGEWCRVHSVTSSTVVTIYTTLYAEYTTAVQVRKLVGARTVFRGFKVKQPNALNLALRVSLIDSPRVEDVETGGSTYAGIELDRCVDIAAYGGARQGPYLGSDQYGLAISNCQGGEVHGVYYAGKHSILLGGGDETGSVPCRAITIYAPVMAAGGATANQDVHGNTEDITFVGGVYYNGGQISGKNHKFLGCTFRGLGNSGIALYCGEPVSGEFQFNGCRFESLNNPNASSRGVIDLQNLTAQVSGPITLIFTNSVITVPGSTQYLVRISMDGINQDVSVMFDGVHLSAGGITQFVRASKSAGSGAIDVLRIKGVSGFPLNAAWYQLGAGSLTVRKYQLPACTGTATVAISTGASAASATVNFPAAYPIAPAIVSSLTLNTVGGKRSVCAPVSPSATGFSATVATTDGANFSSSDTATVMWQAGIDQ